jgi:hypothetical protein
VSRPWCGHSRTICSVRPGNGPPPHSAQIISIARGPCAVATIAGDRFRAANPPTRPQPPQYAFPRARKPTAAHEQADPNTNDLQYRGPTRHVAGADWEHSAYVLLIDKHGVQRVGIPFEQVTAASLARDVRTLAAEGVADRLAPRRAGAQHLTFQI